MYAREHGPPHFHARHGGDYASVAIDHPVMLRGRLPPRAAALVIEWAVLRQAELHEAWPSGSACSAASRPAASRRWTDRARPRPYGAAAAAGCGEVVLR